MTADPASAPASSWAGRLAALKSRQVPDADPRVVEARQALAFHRLHRAISAERGQLSPAGADRLRAQISEGVA
jgi:hypothetical protein